MIQIYILNTHTALHNICHDITRSINKMKHLQCTFAVALDMSKTFNMKEHTKIYTQTYITKHSKHKH